MPLLQWGMRMSGKRETEARTVRQPAGWILPWPVGRRGQ